MIDQNDNSLTKAHGGPESDSCRIVSLSSTRLGAEVIKKEVEKHSTSPLSGLHLENVSLCVSNSTGRYTHIGIDAVTNAVYQNSFLTYLNLSNNNLHSREVDCLSKVLEGNPVLTDLNISGNDILRRRRLGMVDIETMTVWCETLSSMNALTTLDVSNTQLGQFVYPVDLTGWRQAGVDEEKEYQHSDGRTQDEKPSETLVPGKSQGVLIFAKCLARHPTLTTVRMAHNQIQGADAGTALASALAHNPVLLELDLSRQPTWQGRGIPCPDFVKELAKGLGTNKTLRKLIMGNNSLQGTEAGKALGQAIAVNSRLSELDLSSHPGDCGYSCPNDDAFIKAISPFLGNTHLTTLDLSCNALFGDERRCVEALADMLKTNSSLRKLNLATTNMCAVHAKIIANGVRTNTSMEFLDIRGNNLREGDAIGWTGHTTPDGKKYYAKEGEASVWEKPKCDDPSGVEALNNAASANIKIFMDG